VQQESVTFAGIFAMMRRGGLNKEPCHAPCVAFSVAPVPKAAHAHRAARTFAAVDAAGHASVEMPGSSGADVCLLGTVIRTLERFQT
jgi:hypothetical protein